MAHEISTSTNIEDYEILIRRRGDSQYSSYCPQLYMIINGFAHEEVEERMKEEILKHIEELQKQAES